MKIIVDQNIPYIKGVVEQFGEVSYLPGADFSKDNIKDADTLIVRTVSRFDAINLQASKVKLICSATIGYDHIDIAYCNQHDIVWKNAPGCNSGSVQQYVASALITMALKKNFRLSDKTIGIIGLGNVGKKVATICELLGMKVLKNDPPRQDKEHTDEFVTLERIKQEADIITFHTPLSRDGQYPTYHLADDSFFHGLKKKPIVINSARGSIINTNAIKNAIKNDLISGAIIDCWEGEPDIDLDYMHMVDIATPHIAGYSADGKANATKMSLNAIAEFWKLPKAPLKTIEIPEIKNSSIDYNALSSENKVWEAILATYDPLVDHNNLYLNPKDFSKLRSNYPLRREFNAYSVKNIIDKTEINLLEKIGFMIQ